MAGDEGDVYNDAAPWSNFDPDGYWKYNYSSILPEDAEIIRYAGQFLAADRHRQPLIRCAVDVGAGTNLYPALLMLPWAERIILTDFVESNIDWLNNNLSNLPGDWERQPFWDLLADLPGYQRIQDPRYDLATRCETRHLSIFELPEQSWDLGSMFFVADGITTDAAEFRSALNRFLGALTPGAPFMMAFMENSAGYDVSGIRFPAVRIASESLSGLLGCLPITVDNVLRTDKSARPLRTGYDAMLLVTGHLDR